MKRNNLMAKRLDICDLIDTSGIDIDGIKKEHGNLPMDAIGASAIIVLLEKINMMDAKIKSITERNNL